MDEEKMRMLHSMIEEETLTNDDTFEGKQLKIIVCDCSMSEHHLGGDNIIDIARQILNAQNEGYQIHTWYGNDTEVLIIGLKAQILVQKRPI